MLRRSEQFDLGLDTTRIKDPNDAARQSATVDALLERFFHDDVRRRWAIQILADEVGMGKTFVALGVAYSILQAMKQDAADDDLAHCYKKILIITPNNPSLFNKWVREVGEFVKRCVRPEHRDEAARWFRPVEVDRIDDLTRELHRKGNGAASVIITKMSVFGGAKLHDYDLKRRQLLGVLFRLWSNGFNYEQRDRLLKGAPDGWPSDHGSLLDLSDWQRELLQFDDEELLAALRKHKRAIPTKKLLDTCREIAAPYKRNRKEMFSNVESQLVDLYRKLMTILIRRSIPLVIVDEAHNWRNRTNGFSGFQKRIAGRTRRALLLTATPFQLRPNEMLTILEPGRKLRVTRNKAASEERVEQFCKHCGFVAEILSQATAASKLFANAWKKVPTSVSSHEIRDAWSTPEVTLAREQLLEAARQHGVVDAKDFMPIIDVAVADLDPNLRQLIRAGLKLFVYNSDLSHELGALVIRHRRHADHRLFRIGSEYSGESDGVVNRPDRHVLHVAPGLDVRGDGELPHYLLMRCVSEMKGGKGRSSLGSALTGCYSTLTESAEGKAVNQKLTESPTGKAYLDLLTALVDKTQDPHHPKLRQVVETALQNWQAGEKTLIFCFRTNTAERLRDILGERIGAELDRRLENCLGSPESIKSLRTRLTGRDRDLIVLGLDRILWSLMWASRFPEPRSGRSLVPNVISPDDLNLRDDEWPLLARLVLRYGIDLHGERIDRVFLHRASEHIVAQRLLRTRQPEGLLARVLTDIADESWISHPYGVHSERHFQDDRHDHDAAPDDSAPKESLHFDERGVHTTYEPRTPADEFSNEPTREAVDATVQELKLHHVVIGAYGSGPNFWLGSHPQSAWEKADQTRHAPNARLLAELHRHLLDLMLEGDALNWAARLYVMQGLRQAVFRESVLLRLLPEKTVEKQTTWGKLLAHTFFSALPGQSESMADRITVYLEDLAAASGSITDPKTARYTLYTATRLAHHRFVALVSGKTDRETRERVFAGFNSPLAPEVLICTSVGQEGIDLHRHCRHVVHFDLAWNPAVLEQRTGRADRIGSKTFRERARTNGSPTVHLDIGVPYLAGTYDERMYEELRIRAQTFEVLTGGDLTPDDPTGSESEKHAEGEESNLHLVPLPDEMLQDLRVWLHVWAPRAVAAPERDRHASIETLTQALLE